MKSLHVQSLILILCIAATAFAAPSSESDGFRNCDMKGYLGVNYQEISNQKLSNKGFEKKNGIYVTNVIGCSAAHEAGLQPMDYIYAVNGESSKKSDSFFCMLSEISPDESFSLSIDRAGGQMDIQVTMGKKPQHCDNNTPFKKRGFFGINRTSIDNKPGVIIDVSSKGPVSRLGLRDGDRLLRVNGFLISDWEDLGLVKRLITDLEQVQFEVIRDEEDLSFVGAIPKSEHEMISVSRSIIEKCEEEIIQSISEIDIDEIELEIENKLRESKIEEIALDAVDEVMESVREVLNDFRVTDNDATVIYDSTEELDAKVTAPSVADMNQMGAIISDMPSNINLEVNNFAASPNPNEGMFNLEFNLPNSGETSIKIYSAAGREIYSYDLGEYSGAFNDRLDIMKNGPGVYFLMVRQDDKAFVKKIVLVKRS